MSNDKTSDFARLSAEVESLKKQVEFQKEFSAFRLEVQQTITYFKWLGGTIAAIISVAGLLGWKSLTDVTATARARIDQKVDELSDRSYTLSKGFALADSGRSKDAIPFLLKALDQNPRDEPVIRALLGAVDDAEAWSEGAPVVKDLLGDAGRLEKIQDPMIYNQLAVILIDERPDDPQSLDLASHLLERALRRLRNDDSDRRYPLNNLFRIRFIMNDLKGAKQHLGLALPLYDPPLELSSVKQEKWLRMLRIRRPSVDKELDQIWPPNSKAP